ncbi:MAG: hypothetical protein OES46_11965 [Gammaproteobacteria bacterium]|nr:hypothetical protein [Gammaproteobacteria bacterium]
MASNTNAISFTREMGISHAEFRRTLPRALEHHSYEILDDHIIITDALGTLEIRLSPEYSRKLGALMLPVTNVYFTFKGYNSSEVKSFMQHFDLYFQRGGG